MIPLACRHSKEDVLKEYWSICWLLYSISKSSDLPDTPQWRYVKASMTEACISRNQLKYDSSRSYCTDYNEEHCDETHYFDHYETGYNTTVYVHYFCGNVYFIYSAEKSGVYFQVASGRVASGSIGDYNFVYTQKIGEYVYKVIRFSPCYYYYSILYRGKEIASGSIDVPFLSPLLAPRYML